MSIAGAMAGALAAILGGRRSIRKLPAEDQYQLGFNAGVRESRIVFAHAVERLETSFNSILEDVRKSQRSRSLAGIIDLDNPTAKITVRRPASEIDVWAITITVKEPRTSVEVKELKRDD